MTMCIDNLCFDVDGFVSQAVEEWDAEKAQRIAALDGYGPLTDSQLDLLKHLRDQYLRRGTPPALPHVCRSRGYGPNCLNQMFPSAHEAWRIAGLPNPGDEAVSYL
jgi:sulfur relay (sulfurtransferase) DsrC/TusE family protein